MTFLLRCGALQLVAVVSAAVESSAAYDQGSRIQAQDTVYDAHVDDGTSLLQVQSITASGKTRPSGHQQVCKKLCEKNFAELPGEPFKYRMDDNISAAYYALNFDGKCSSACLWVRTALQYSDMTVGATCKQMMCAFTTHGNNGDNSSKSAGYEVCGLGCGLGFLRHTVGAQEACDHECHENQPAIALIAEKYGMKTPPVFKNVCSSACFWLKSARMDPAAVLTETCKYGLCAAAMNTSIAKGESLLISQAEYGSCSLGCEKAKNALQL